MKFDAQGVLVVRTGSRMSQSDTLTRLDPTGAVVFSTTDLVGGAGDGTPFAIAPSGDILTVDGALLRRWTPAGVVTSTITPPAPVHRVVTDAAGRMLVIGLRGGLGTDTLGRELAEPWAGVYSPPSRAVIRRLAREVHRAP